MEPHDNPFRPYPIAWMFTTSFRYDESLENESLENECFNKEDEFDKIKLYFD